MQGVAVDCAQARNIRVIVEATGSFGSGNGGVYPHKLAFDETRVGRVYTRVSVPLPGVDEIRRGQLASLARKDGMQCSNKSKQKIRGPVEGLLRRNLTTRSVKYCSRTAQIFQDTVRLDSNSYDMDLRLPRKEWRSSVVLVSNSLRPLLRGAPPPVNLGSCMAELFCPRLSEAMHFLPLLRKHLVATASQYALPTGLAIDLLPIVEGGLFGYELLPDRKTHTYVIIGCNAQGEPVLRKTVYGVDASNALQLVAVNGHLLSRTERASRYSTQQRDSHFLDWPVAAESGWAQLLILFPERPRQPIAVRENIHRCLDEALSIAHSHLAHWNPFIQFCGLPNEAQQGFALRGTDGEHGELVFQRPDIWMLRWRAPPQAVYESWSVVVPDPDAARDMARRDLAS